MNYGIFLSLLLITVSCKQSVYEQKNAEAMDSGAAKDETLTYEVLNLENGYGFNILKCGKIYIHQPFIPAVAGKTPFVNRETAIETARLIIQRLPNIEIRFLIEKEDIDSIIKPFTLTAADRVGTQKNPAIRVSVADGEIENNIQALQLLPDAPVKIQWKKVGTVPFGNRGGMMSVAIDDKLYMAGGENKDLSAKDFWRYDPFQNYWTCLAEIPRGRRISGVSFAIGGKGYVGLGSRRGENSKVFNNDFYSYDPTRNTWQRCSDFPGSGRIDAAAFAINGKGYAGTGYDEDYRQDMYEYNPVSDQWKRIQDFPGGNISAATGISTGTKGFILTGDRVPGNNKKFIYEYVQPEGKWEKLPDIPGKARYFSSAFAIDSTKFIAGCGRAEGGEVWFKDFFLYDVTTCAWVALPDYPIETNGNSRLCGGTVRGKIFAGCGYNRKFLNDWNVFEYYFSVRTDTGVYNEGACYALPYNGQWQLFQECSNKDCFAGMAINSRQQLGKLCYTSNLAGALRTWQTGNGQNRGYTIFPRSFVIRTEKRIDTTIALRLFFTRKEIAEGLNAIKEKTGRSPSLNDMVILQCNESNPDIDPLNNHFTQSRPAKPHWYAYGFEGETMVAELTVQTLHSEFYLALPPEQ